MIAACTDENELAKENNSLTQGGTMITVNASMPTDKSVSKVGLK